MSSLLDALALKPGETDRFIAPGGRGGWTNLFGGQLVAHAAHAATLTVGEDRVLHSLHASFLSAGKLDVPLEFQVERERDGAAFSARRVTAAQAGKRVISLAASFHVEEPGNNRDLFEIPEVPPPDSLAKAADASGPFSNDAPEQSPLAHVDVRPIENCQPFAPTPGGPSGKMWLRIPSGAGANRGQQRVMLAYVSDLFLINTAITPQLAEMGPKSQSASLTHVVWIHDDPDVSEWMLYVQNSPWAGKTRALCQGAIFAADGRHMATISQEALVRTGAKA